MWVGVGRYVRLCVDACVRVFGVCVCVCVCLVFGVWCLLFGVWCVPVCVPVLPGGHKSAAVVVL